MKTVLRAAFALLTLVSLTGFFSNAIAQTYSVDDVIRAFRDYDNSPRWLGDCSKAMRAGLEKYYPAVPTAADLKEMSEAMQKNKCFADRWSAIELAEETRGTQGATAVDAGDRATMEVAKDVLIVRIPTFGVNVVDALDNDFARLPVGWQSYVQLVVVDLRGNRGGSIDKLAEVLDKYFSPEKGRTYLEFLWSRYYPISSKTKYAGLLFGWPLIILENYETASACELFMATMKYDWKPDQTTIVGTPSTGKAVVQTLTTVGPFVLRITSGQWDLPRHQINGQGMAPDKEAYLSRCKVNGCILETLADLGLR